MPYLTTDHAHAASVDLYYEDHGEGPPVVLVHGYPFDARLWDSQVSILRGAGYRTVVYDRRGFGRSSASPDGADFDTFAADLDVVMTRLGLVGAALVGHAMGTGEAVRYLRNHGSSRVAKLVLLAPLVPFLLRTVENPTGIELSYFDAQISAARQDPTNYLDHLVDDFFNVDENLGSRLDETAVARWRKLARLLSPRTGAAAIPTWITDFRADVTGIAVPTLVVHGTRDRVLPIESTSRPLRELMPHAQYVEIEGAPHGLVQTHADAVATVVLDFLGSASGE